MNDNNLELTVDSLLKIISDFMGYPCDYCMEDTHGKPLNFETFMVEYNPDFCEGDCKNYSCLECWRKLFETSMKNREVKADADSN